MAVIDQPYPGARHRRRPAAGPLSIALVLLVGLLPAVDLPLQSIIAVDPVGDGEGLDAGGAAVIIDAEARLALTLAEVVPADADEMAVILPGGFRHTATVIRRGSTSTGVLLELPAAAGELVAIACADDSQARPGDAVYSIGNPYDALALDGRAAISAGIVSGRYAIPHTAPPVRGRLGSVLSGYRGPVLETDAAVNDGNQGGALVDADGRLLGICSLGVARQRRMGTAIPLAVLCDDLGLDPPLHRPAGQPDPVQAALRDHAATLADGLALIYLERPAGPGNPPSMPRPRPIGPDVPSYLRENLEKEWGRYYHQQQVFFTDQAVTALVLDAEAGLLLTAASNLHGNATSGMVIDHREELSRRFTLLARHGTLDLALLECDGPLTGYRSLDLDPDPDLHSGDPVALVARHRNGGPYTITSGIVSATQRRDDQTAEALHQTDALANYGSLGGALIDAHGALVGLLTHMNPASPWKINSGVAIFVDSGTIGQVLPQLRAGTSIEQGDRVVMGILPQWKEGVGLLVGAVSPGSGAADAGVQVGDRIVRIAGQDLQERIDVRRILIRHQAGDIVPVLIERSGELLTLDVELRRQ